MGKKSILQDKSFDFAILIVKLYRYLCENKKEFVLSKQLLRSGTAIGALLREGYYAESKADFIHKFSIAQKECNETIYWIRLLKHGEYLTEQDAERFEQLATELLKMITSSILTLKKSLNPNH